MTMNGLGTAAKQRGGKKANTELQRKIELNLKCAKEDKGCGRST